MSSRAIKSPVGKRLMTICPEHVSGRPPSNKGPLRPYSLSFSSPPYPHPLTFARVPLRSDSIWTCAWKPKSDGSIEIAKRLDTKHITRAYCNKMSGTNEGGSRGYAACGRYEFQGESNEAVDTTARLIAKLAEKASKEFRQQQVKESRLLRSKANYFIPTCRLPRTRDRFVLLPVATPRDRPRLAQVTAIGNFNARPVLPNDFIQRNGCRGVVRSGVHDRCPNSGIDTAPLVYLRVDGPSLVAYEPPEKNKYKNFNLIIRSMIYYTKIYRIQNWQYNVLKMTHKVVATMQNMGCRSYLRSTTHFVLIADNDMSAILRNGKWQILAYYPGFVDYLNSLLNTCQRNRIYEYSGSGRVRGDFLLSFETSWLLVENPISPLRIANSKILKGLINKNALQDFNFVLDKTDLQYQNKSSI
ncbi:hypothetical protein ALC53_01247 [Atta colombica]|uniref:Uncharacterized protein n=1 Tax=Atta colombica TaxID=520822 RepID=A0A195BU94_9HYME|nr:hypothetical protein ALC53_01247 [Atta colombica]